MRGSWSLPPEDPRFLPPAVGQSATGCAEPLRHSFHFALLVGRSAAVSRRRRREFRTGRWGTGDDEEEKESQKRNETVKQT